MRCTDWTQSGCVTVTYALTEAKLPNIYYVYILLCPLKFKLLCSPRNPILSMVILYLSTNVTDKYLSTQSVGASRMLRNNLFDLCCQVICQICNICFVSTIHGFLQTNCPSERLFVLACFILFRFLFSLSVCLPFFFSFLPPLSFLFLSVTGGLGEENGEEPFFQITAPTKPPAPLSEEEEEDELVRKAL